MKNLSMIAVTAFAAPIAFAAPQFRPMAMTVNRSDGAVVSFDLSFSQAAGTTALYACWGSSDAGATTSTAARASAARIRAHRMRCRARPSIIVVIANAPPSSLPRVCACEGCSRR